ncbi:MAG: hypothetical protein A2Z34_03880 [Planctomycetes bacterium RBG_16_59_8]|nr:MAG: hypothetical protein A2Z34_03880 [Planctomycetes bacterium RBG_16_59_8]
MSEHRLMPQSEWGWKVAVYLFLAGAGAGAYTWGAVADLFGGASSLVSKTGLLLGFPLVFIGTLFLIADLGVKPRALRVFMNPGSSWIARGTFIISTFMILGAIHFAAGIWPFRWLMEQESLRHIIGAVNILFAALTMLYTGILLGASRPISLWSTAMLPALFLISALSTGAMAIAFSLAVGEMAAILPGQNDSIARLATLDAILIVAEALAIVVYLQATHKTEESRESLRLMLKGAYAPLFWIGVVALGLIVPLTSAVAEGASFLAVPTIMVAATSLCGLLGGFFLRYAVLACGVRAPLRAGGIAYTFPSTCAR